MSQRTLSISVLATLLLAIGGVSAQAADQTFTVRIENVSVGNILKLSNGKTAAVTVAPVLYVITRTARRCSRPASRIAARDSRPWRRMDLRARSRNP